MVYMLTSLPSLSQAGGLVTATTTGMAQRCVGKSGLFSGLTHIDMSGLQKVPALITAPTATVIPAGGRDWTRDSEKQTQYSKLHVSV